MINEPTAAAIAHGLEHFGEDRRMLVFDLGGGTFDVTIMDIEGITFRTIASDGDAELGGKDWDDRIVNFAAALFEAQFGIDPRDDPQSYQELYERCVAAKLALSTKPRAVIPINHGGNRTVIEMSREQFEGLTRDLVQQCADTCLKLLERHNMVWSDIDEVLLVGGSTRMPMIRALVTELAGDASTPDINPDQCVAIGASLAAVLRHKPGHPALRRVRQSLKDQARRKQISALEAELSGVDDPQDEVEATASTEEPAPDVAASPDEAEAGGSESPDAPTEVEAEFVEAPDDGSGEEPEATHSIDDLDDDLDAPAPPPIVPTAPEMWAKNEGEDAALAITMPDEAPSDEQEEMDEDDVTDPGIPAVTIADACTHPLGIIVLNDDLAERVVTLIDAATPVPCERRGRFAYAYDNMTAVSVEITEGVGEARDEVVVIGQVVLSDLPPRARGTPIDVVYRYNEDQILEIDVVDVETSAIHSAQVNLTGALDSEAMAAAADLISETTVR